MIHSRDGWLNRLLQVMPEVTSETAFAVGREDMKLLSGSAKVSSWSPDGRLDMSPQARLLLEEVYHDESAFPAMLALKPSQLPKA